jgi:alpha-glucosidase
MLATYLLTLSGTPFILMGQEIGMANLGTEIGIDGYVDVEGRNWYDRVLKERGEGADMSDVLEQMQQKARDHGRLPMQWNEGPNAGFCDKGRTPWMTLNPDYKDWNVKAQEGKDGSVLAYWRRLSALRKREKELLVYGRFEMLPEQKTGEEIIGYERSAGDRRAVVMLSFAEQPTSLCGDKYARWTTLISNMSTPDVEEHRITLRPYEARVLCNHS